jgi:hypothetical protein
MRSGVNKTARENINYKAAWVEHNTASLSGKGLFGYGIIFTSYQRKL